MGYYTDFTLRVNTTDDEICAKISEVMGEDNDSGLAWLNQYGNEWYGNLKWYGHKEDMLRLSKQFPDIIFNLQGEGEEYDDIWEYWFKDGMVQGGQAEIIYPEFDEDNWK